MSNYSVLFQGKCKKIHNLFLVGELHDDTLDDTTMDAIVKVLKQKTLKSPVVLVEARVFDRMNLSDKILEDTERFLQEGYKHLSPVVFFTLMWQHDLKIGNEIIVPYDYRLEEVQKVHAGLSKINFDSRYEREQWLEDVKNVWEDQLHLCQKVVRPNFSIRVWSAFKVLEQVFRKVNSVPPEHWQSIGSHIDQVQNIFLDLWMSIAEAGALYHYNQEIDLFGDLSRDIFVVMGRLHMTESVATFSEVCSSIDSIDSLPFDEVYFDATSPSESKDNGQ